MNKLKFFSLVMLLGAGIISCNKSKPAQTMKYAGIATTFKSEIRQENGTASHIMTRDTLDFELTVIIEGKTIQFLSTNDSIVQSFTFDVRDSIGKNNTYSPYFYSGMARLLRNYRLVQDSLIYTYDYSVLNSINSYSVEFSAIKQ